MIKILLLRTIYSCIAEISSASLTSVDKNDKIPALESCLPQVLLWVVMSEAVYKYFCSYASLSALWWKSRTPLRNILASRLQEHRLRSPIPQAHPPQHNIFPHSKKNHIHKRTTWSQKAIGHIKLNKDLNFHAIHTLMSSISIIHAQGAIVVKGRPKFFDFPLFSHCGRPLIITPKDKLMII